MKSHAAAAASTLMALISTAESFISTPGGTSTARGNRVTSASTPCSVRVPPGCTPASLEDCCRVGGVRRRRGTGLLRLQAKGGGALGAGAATEKRQQQQQATESTRSSVEGAIDGKRQGEVEQLKRKLQREHAFISRIRVFLSVVNDSYMCSCFPKTRLGFSERGSSNVRTDVIIACSRFGHGGAGPGSVVVRSKSAKSKDQ